MPVARVNGVDLFYEVEGSGPPVVIVHGSWTDHTVWQTVADELMGSFHVIGYDRRGYSRSGRPEGARTRRDDEDDLAVMIEKLAGGHAHVVASSFGGLVTLGLAARRPDLLRSICIHEAPSIALAGSGETGRLAADATVGMARVAEQIEAGDAAGGARRFVEELALGPGAWEALPEAVRTLFVDNAPAFAAEQRDGSWSDLDTDELAANRPRLLLTKGTVGPRWLQALQDRLSAALPYADTAVVEGAGHSPHMTHPRQFAEILGAFMAQHALHKPAVI